MKEFLMAMLVGFLAFEACQLGVWLANQPSDLAMFGAVGVIFIAFYGLYRYLIWRFLV